MSEEEGMRERKRREMYDRLVNAARPRFWTETYDAVRIKDIAVAADVSVPTLIRYFPSKALLYLECARRQGQKQEEALYKMLGMDAMTALSQLKGPHVARES